MEVEAVTHALQWLASRKEGRKMHAVNKFLASACDIFLLKIMILTETMSVLSCDLDSSTDNNYILLIIRKMYLLLDGMHFRYLYQLTASV